MISIKTNLHAYAFAFMMNALREAVFKRQTYIQKQIDKYIIFKKELQFFDKESPLK